MTKLARHSEKHRYQLLDGTWVPGASTVSNIHKDFQPLLGWAWGLGMKGLDFRKVRDDAADVGTVAHFMITCFLKGDEPDLSEFPDKIVEKAKGCFDKFVTTWEKEGLTFISNELSLVSEKHRYGGTLDIIASDKEGRITLIDEKTSKSIYDCYIMQLVAYEHLYNEQPHSWHPHTDQKISRRVIFRHGKGGAKDSQIRWFDTEDDQLDWHWSRFLARVALYEADKKPK